MSKMTRRAMVPMAAAATPAAHHPKQGEAELPFVVRKGGKLRFWNVRSTGHFGGDCYLGRLFARELIATIRDDRLPPWLGWIAQAQIEAGSADGVVIGFWTEIGAMLMRIPAVRELADER